MHFFRVSIFVKSQVAHFVRVCLVILSLFCVTNAWAATVTLDKEYSRLPLSKYLLEFEEPGSRLSLEEVTEQLNGGGFKPTKSNIINYGYTDSARWFVFQLYKDRKSVV